MEHTLYAGRHRLIHLLREIQSGCQGVLGHKWQVTQGGGGFWFSKDGQQCYEDMLLAEDLDTNSCVDGMRLMERSALVSDFDEAEIVRFSQSKPGVIDLKLTFHGGAPIVVETDDPSVFDVLYDYFEMTSSESHRSCFT